MRRHFGTTIAADAKNGDPFRLGRVWKGVQGHGGGEGSFDQRIGDMGLRLDQRPGAAGIDGKGGLVFGNGFGAGRLHLAHGGGAGRLAIIDIGQRQTDPPRQR